VDTLQFDNGSGTGELRVESTDPNLGNFTGSLRTLYFTKDANPNGGAFSVTGNLGAEINVVQSFREDITVGGVLDAEQPFTMGRKLHADCVVRFEDTSGLQGQLIINAENGGYTWEGDVEFGPSGSATPLSPVPYYDNKSADIGGGAVGLVPYYLHYNDCTPTAVKVNEDANTGLDGWSDCNGWHVDEVLLTGQSIGEVTLHHDGPIEREGTGMPVTVKRRALA
jgi:hypothetical protein